MEGFCLQSLSFHLGHQSTNILSCWRRATRAMASAGQAGRLPRSLHASESAATNTASQSSSFGRPAGWPSPTSAFHCKAGWGWSAQWKRRLGRRPRSRGRGARPWEIWRVITPITMGCSSGRNSIAIFIGYPRMIDAAGGGARRERKTDSAVSVAVDNPGAIPTGYSHSDAGSANDDFYFRSYHLFLFCRFVHISCLHNKINTIALKPLKKGTFAMIFGVNRRGCGVNLGSGRPRDGS